MISTNKVWVMLSEKYEEEITQQQANIVFDEFL